MLLSGDVAVVADFGGAKALAVAAEPDLTSEVIGRRSAGAVALLRQAYREGAKLIFAGIYSNAHIDAEYAPLRGFAPFNAFAAPIR